MLKIPNKTTLMCTLYIIYNLITSTLDLLIVEVERMNEKSHVLVLVLAHRCTPRSKTEGIYNAVNQLIKATRLTMWIIHDPH